MATGKQVQASMPDRRSGDPRGRRPDVGAAHDEMERDRESVRRADREIAAAQNAREHPSRRRRPPRRRIPPGPNRLLVAITFGTFAVVGAVVSLATGSWWFLALALAVHALATAAVLGAIRSMLARERDEPDPADAAENGLRRIQALGQAIWIDNLTRELIDDGGLRSLIDDDGLTGVTSNPTIFDKAIGGSSRYDAAFEQAVAEGKEPGEIFFSLALGDIRDAADLLRPAFDRTGGRDGFVSFELPPQLAYDADGSIEAAQRFRAEIGRPNVLIKVPGTAEGVRAFEELTAAGQSINVTLLFAVERYEEIAEAYLRGLERRVEAGEPIDAVASVASFFVSRVDTKIDTALEECERSELSGRAGVANAKIAYQSFRRLFSGRRWEPLERRGAQKQRPLWASTSTKDPDYPDTLYVDELIGPETVNTMPDATIAAAREHATAERTIDRDVDSAREHMRLVREVGVDVDDVVCRQLVDEGVESFAGSFDSLIETITGKRDALRRVKPGRH